MCALLVSAPVLSSMPAMIEPLIVMLPMRPRASTKPEMSSDAAPLMLPPTKLPPIVSASMLPVEVIEAVNELVPPTSEPWMTTLPM